MNSALDKVDMVEALSELLDNSHVEGIGWIVQATSDQKEGDLILEIRTDLGEETDFRLRITKMRLP